MLQFALKFGRFGYHTSIKVMQWFSKKGISMSHVLNQLAFTKPDEATKVEAVKLILDGKATVQDIADKYRVGNIQVHGWRKSYGSLAAKRVTDEKLLNLKEHLSVEQKQEEKEEEMPKKKQIKRYSDEEKRTAVELYLDGQKASEVIDAYEVSANTFYKWVNEDKAKKASKKTVKAKAEPKPPEPKAKQKPLEIIKPIYPQRSMPTPMTTTIDHATGGIELYQSELERLRFEAATMKTIIVDQLLELMRYRGTKH